MKTDRGSWSGGNRRWIVLVGLNVMYAALLVALAVSPRIPGEYDMRDSIVHAIAYGLQAVLIFTLLSKSWPTASALAASWLGATAFGCVTETLQMLRPTRSADLMDIVADGFGALVACASIAAIRAVRGERGGSG